MKNKLIVYLLKNIVYVTGVLFNMIGGVASCITWYLFILIQMYLSTALINMYKMYNVSIPKRINQLQYQFLTVQF